MSDTTSDSGMGKKKKSFASRFSGKLHNPFKKGHSDSDDDDDSSSRGHHGTSSNASVSPPVTGKHSPKRSGFLSRMEGSINDRVQQPAAAAQQAVQTAMTNVKQAVPGVDPNPPPPAVPPRGQPSHAPAGTSALPGAPTTTAAQPSDVQKPAARPTDTVAPTGPTAAGSTSADGTTASAATAGVEEEKRKERVVVGGPVYGVAEIVLTGIKGEPDDVMKVLRGRGFVVHLVRNGRENVSRHCILKFEECA